MLTALWAKCSKALYKPMYYYYLYTNAKKLFNQLRKSRTIWNFCFGLKAKM